MLPLISLKLLDRSLSLLSLGCSLLLYLVLLILSFLDLCGSLLTLPFLPVLLRLHCQGCDRDPKLWALLLLLEGSSSFSCRSCRFCFGFR